jgi:hypothetical protein
MQLEDGLIGLYRSCQIAGLVEARRPREQFLAALLLGQSLTGPDDQGQYYDAQGGVTQELSAWFQRGGRP